MDSLQFLLQLRFTHDIPPRELDLVVQKLQWVLEDAIGDGALDIETVEVFDYDLQFEIY